MKRISLFCTAILLLVTQPLLGQDAVLHVRDLMTAEQVRNTGLEKLSPTELTELDRWLSSVLLRAATARGPAGANAIDQFEGCQVVASDGQFLGIITKTPSADSIGNTIGRFGSTISPTSVFNTIGEYGSSISPQSAFNTIAANPPQILCGSRLAGYLTVNTIKFPRLDPRALSAWIGR